LTLLIDETNVISLTGLIRFIHNLVGGNLLDHPVNKKNATVSK